MKNALKVIAIVLAAALLFGIGYSLGSKSGITINLNVNGLENSGATTNTDVPVNNTTEPTEQQEDTTLPPEDTTEGTDTTETPEATTKQNQENTTKKPSNKDNKGGVPSSTAEIVAAYNKVITDAKAAKKVTINKKETVDIKVTDCSIPAASSLINPILSKFMKPIDDTMVFTDGYSADYNRYVGQVIPPSDRPVKLTAAAVATAKATAKGDGYVMDIKLKSEKSTFDGTNTVNPDFNNSAVDPLNLATLDISPAQITNADMSYPGTTLSATVDGKGRLTKLVVTIPMEGTGTGSIKIFDLSLGLAGQLVDVYTVTY